MTTTTMSERPLFEILGLTESEERVYLYMLDADDRSEEALSAALDIPPKTLQRALASLISHGLAVRDPEGSDIVPNPPDIALEALIRRRQEELERVRLRVPSLESGYRHRAWGDLDATEIESLEATEALLQRFTQTQLIAKTEVCIARRRPRLDDRSIELEGEALDRGIRYRSLQSIEDLGRWGLEALKKLISAGERARVAPVVAFDLLLVDRRVAVIGLPDAEGDRKSIGWVARPGPVLDILQAHFDSLWAAGQDVSAGRLTSSEMHELAEDERDLLVLLARGLTDDAIGRSLDLAPRTVQRRVSRLLEKLGARSRFQAGVEAVRRGWA